MKELSLHILDVAMNSVRADADKVTVQIVECSKLNKLEIIISDNGCGMNKETLESAIDPFISSKKYKRVGLGIPLLKASAEQCNGSFSLNSEIEIGTELKCVFQHDHIDRPIMGNISNVMTMLYSSHPEVNFILNYSVDDVVFELSSDELKKELDPISISTPEIFKLIENIVKTNLEEISICY